MGTDISPNYLIFQRANIGLRSAGDLPVIDRHVDIGAVTRILGSVTIDVNAVLTGNVLALENAVGFR